MKVIKHIIGLAEAVARFIGHQICNFERSLSLSRGTKSVLFCHASFSLGGPGIDYIGICAVLLYLKLYIFF
jgi:hypothetical protein